MSKLKSPTLLINMFRNTLRFILQLSLAVLNFITTVIFAHLGIILFVPLKTCVFICAKIFRRDLLHFVPSSSSLHTMEDIGTRPKMNLILFAIADGHIEIDKLRECFQNRIIKKLKPQPNSITSKLMYPELTQYWTTFLNYTFWKADENFDLRNHVRLYDYGQSKGHIHGLGDDGDLCLPDIKDGLYIDENGLNRLIGLLLVKPWKKKQSPWEMLLIQNFKSNKNSSQNDACTKPSTVIVIRLHHALGDGYSLLKLFLRDLALDPPNIRINFPRMKTWKKIGFSLILPFKMCWDVAGSSINSYDGTTSWHGPRKSLQLLTNLSNPIDTQLIKSIKNKYGVGYNAVLVAAVAASCRRLMEDAGQVVPDDLSCFTPIPLPGHPDGLINHVTMDFLKWPLSSTATRGERLRKISKQMSKSKYYTAPLGIYWLGKYMNIVPNFMIKCTRQTVRYCTAGMTSFPGPQAAVPFNGMGVNIVDLFAAAGPAAGTIGFVVAMISMNGKQRFTSLIDKSIFNSENLFQNFDTYIEEELVALLDENADSKLNFV